MDKHEQLLRTNLDALWGTLNRLGVREDLTGDELTKFNELLTIARYIEDQLPKIN